MGCWSPLDAMNAYVRTLQLCKEYSNNTTNKLLEPECIEFISALAAGNRAQRMVAVTSDGSSPSTLALAIAARCTGGRLVCRSRGSKRSTSKRTFLVFVRNETKHRYMLQESQNMQFWNKSASTLNLIFSNEREKRCAAFQLQRLHEGGVISYKPSLMEEFEFVAYYMLYWN